MLSPLHALALGRAETVANQRFEVSAGAGGRQLRPLGELDRHLRGDVGNRIERARDESGFAEAASIQREEMADAGPAALGERGDLLVVSGPGKARPFRPGVALRKASITA